MKKHSLILLALLLGTQTLSSACNDFDVQARIEDLRVLAVRTTPAEIKYSSIYALAPPDQRPPGLPLPEYSVDVEVFAFEPRGGEIETSFTFCPEGTGSNCQNNDVDFLVEQNARSDDDRVAIEAAFGERVSTQTLTPNTLVPEGALSDLNYTLDIKPAVLDSLLPKVDGRVIPQFFPIEPRVAVSVTNNDIERTDAEGNRNVFREIAFKRIPFSLDFGDPTLPAEFRDGLGQAFGIEFCEDPKNFDDYTIGPGDCFYALPANENPNLLGFQLLLDSEEEFAEGTIINEDVDLGVNSLLGATPGETIRVQPVFAEGTLERQQVVKFDIETSTLFIENFFEDLAVTWFVTRGDVQSDNTTEQFTQRLGNGWTLPRNAQVGERDTMVIVVRDQRGGTSVGRITVQY